MDLTLVPYQQHENNDNDNTTTVKYKECMRNHAASIGGHANDGCGEFMPRPESTTSSTDSLTCAACGCHRNFHRRETIGEDGVESPSFSHRLVIHQPPPPMLLYKSYHHHHHHRIGGGGMHVTVDQSKTELDRRSETPEREEMNLNLGPTGKVKRHRTKFTQEQKERMLEFAERSGWRMNRQDDVALNRFCAEVGITRNVLKVWMHNHKNAHRRRDHDPPPPVVAAPPHPQPAGV